MKTFLIIVGVLLLVALFADFWPLIVLPLGAGAGVAIFLGSVIAGIITVAVAALLIVLLAVGGLVVGLLSATAPVWIPLAVILGLVALFRRSNTARAS